MNPLTAFLKARLDELEVMARIVECSADHDTPAGGENDPGITIEDNQGKDCFSIRSDNHDGSEDLIHFCDWPALKAAIDKHQAERGGRV